MPDWRPRFEKAKTLVRVLHVDENLMGAVCFRNERNKAVPVFQLIINTVTE